MISGESLDLFAGVSQIEPPRAPEATPIAEALFEPSPCCPGAVVCRYPGGRKYCGECGCDIDDAPIAPAIETPPSEPAEDPMLEEAERELLQAFGDPVEVEAAGRALEEAGRAMAQAFATPTAEKPPEPAAEAEEGQLWLFDPTEPWRIEWNGMPEFSLEDLSPMHSVIVHFESEGDVLAFEALVGQSMGKMRTAGFGRYVHQIWYPEAEITRMADKRYADGGNE